MFVRFHYLVLATYILDNGINRTYILDDGINRTYILDDGINSLAYFHKDVRSQWVM